jgi:polyphosphate kinase
VTYNDHLKNILVQILESYNYLKEIKDKPGDLKNIKKEMLKINGFLKVITNKIDSENIYLSDFKPLKFKIKQYLENYSFEQEIDTMIPLYSDDVHRIKNMRLKILESLEDKKMIYDVEGLIEKL